ncbi:MAG: hypothetical protein L0196_11580 [candidate division Zixibacteria bacterium]|nr:hypothetical protein [candidate division Zixibacteria bacterium]
MRKTGLLLLGVLFLPIGSLSAQTPDERDSMILESKIVAPIAGASGSGVVRMRVSITNKDSLAYMVLPLIERSLSGGAYMTLSRPRSFTGVVALLTDNTLRYFTGVSFRYNSVSPDTFLLAAGGDGVDPSTNEPPNPTRKGVWDIKFDTVTKVDPVGTVGFDSGRVSGQIPYFTKTGAIDVPVNFVASVIQVGVPFQLDLIAPPDGAVIPEQRPTFLWYSLRDTATIPATYMVFLADNPSFSPTDTSPPLPDTTWQVPADLQVGATYYWKVRAVTADDDTSFSLETRTFRLDATPTPPVDISPPSGSDLSMFDYLIWLESTDPDPGDQLTYQLQIDDNFDFSSPEVNQSGIDENTVSQEGVTAPALRAFPNALAVQLSALADHDNLKDDSSYFWRVRAVDNHGGTSAYTSGLRQFYLNLADSSPRPVPGGFSPSGGIVLTEHRPLFSWFQSSDPDDPPSSLRYELRLDRDGEITDDFEFRYLTPPGETTLVAPDSLAENGHWFWAVRTVDAKGARSAFSPLQDFYINAVNEPLPPFSLLSPPDNGFTVTRMPTLDWADATDPDPFDAVTYEVSVAPLANFDSAVTVGGLITSSFTVPTGALTVRGRQYYWKVTAFDMQGAPTPSNEVFRFTLLKLGDTNMDNQLTAADIVILLGFIFLGDPLTPPEVADLDCNGAYTGADIVLTVNATFLDQSPPCDP